MNEIDMICRDWAERNNAKEEPGDFYQDGLLHCGKCGTPKQTYWDFEDGPVLTGCMCQCEREAYDKKRQEELRQREIQDRFYSVSELRIQCLQDTFLQRCTFQTADESRNIARCRTYVQRWPEMLESGSGLLFWGGVGTGKTFAAACVANAVIDRGWPALVTSFPRILNSSQDKTELTEEMKYYHLLVLDDLGAERDSEYALEIVHQVVDERNKSGLPLIVTTNLTLSELENPRDIRYARIYDRVLEMCVPVQFSGPSRRLKKREERLSFAREVFG